MKKQVRMAGSAAAQLSKIREKLGHCTMEWKPKRWLDTGHPDLNEVFGHRDYGLPYGRITEISGWESQGKTAVAKKLAALAQHQGAGIVWGDFETSFDPNWAVTLGLDPEKVFLVQPYVGTFGSERQERMATAQELCEEIEASMELAYKQYEHGIVVIDSVPAMLPEGEMGAGLVDANLRSNMDLPMFLGRLLRRWIGIAQARDMSIILINQLRQNPMARFGDPVYTTGGNAIRFYCHSRVRIWRAAGGRMKGSMGKTIGIQGIIENRKNKSGSPERARIGFKLFNNGTLEFVPAKSLQKKEDEDEE